MFCPACSSEASPTQKFCRNCGLNLEGLGQRVHDHQGQPVVSLSDNLLKWGTRAAFGGLGLLAIAPLLALIKLAFDIAGGSAFNTLMAIVIAVPIILIVGGGAIALSQIIRRKRFPPKNKATAPDTLVYKTVELLEPSTADEVLSVTEETTRNLSPLPLEKIQK